MIDLECQHSQGFADGELNQSEAHSIDDVTYIGQPLASISLVAENLEEPKSNNWDLSWREVNLVSTTSNDSWLIIYVG